MPDVLTAIVVNFNRRELLLRAVDSLRAQTRVPDAITVVDNASSDDSVAALQRAHGAAVRVVLLASNTGSAGGFHAGINAALTGGANELLLLDSDVVLAPDCIEQLQRFLRAHPEAGVAGPKVHHLESTSVLQEFGGWMDWETADLRRSHFRHDEATGGSVTADQWVDYVPACCLLATRPAIEAAGNFDPGWFLYWDDIDWCARVRAAGRRVGAVAGARVQHFSGRDHKKSLVPVYYGWRNRVAFFLRHTPAERRNATWRALFTDCLLARFTCAALNLPRIAQMMKIALDDALTGVFGPKDFSHAHIAMDAAPGTEMSPGADVVSVHHVISSATADLASRPGAVLLDRFGKRLPAGRAWKLRQEFEIRLARELPGILARAAQGGA